MLFASAVPLRPGKTDRYRDLATELKPHLEEYQDLNRRFEVGAHAFWINHVRDNDIGVSVCTTSPRPGWLGWVFVSGIEARPTTVGGWNSLET
ncbi:MAG: hypothetical protein ABW021_08770 [Acidimicrobiia bacterium]